MIKVILFDIDNTLLSFDGYVREALKSGFPLFGLGEANEETFSTFTRINTGLWRELEEGRIDFEEIQKVRFNRIFRALKKEGDGAAFEDYFRACLFDSAILEDGAIQALSALSPRFILGAASNGPYRQQLHRLELGGLLPYFSHFFISEEMGHSKPSAEYFALCMKRLREKGEEMLLPEEVLMVGDSLTSDIGGGQRAGMKTCFYNPKKKELPLEIRPTYTVEHLLQIPALLEISE